LGECGGLGDDGCGGSGGGDAGEGGGGGSGEGGGREGGEGGAGHEGCGSLARRTGSGGDGSGGGGGSAGSIEGAATNKEPMKPRSARTARMAARRPTMGRRFPRTALILPMHFPKKDPPGLVDSAKWTRRLAAAGAAAAPAPALPPFPLSAGAAAGAWAAGLLEAPRAGIAAIAGRPLTAGAIPRSGPFAPDASRQIRDSRPNLRRNDAHPQLTMCASLHLSITSVRHTAHTLDF